MLSRRKMSPTKWPLSDSPQCDNTQCCFRRLLNLPPDKRPVFFGTLCLIVTGKGKSVSRSHLKYMQLKIHPLKDWVRREANIWYHFYYFILLNWKQSFNAGSFNDYEAVKLWPEGFFGKESIAIILFLTDAYKGVLSFSILRNSFWEISPSQHLPLYSIY